MADEVDRLEIAVDVAAKNANRSLTALEQKIGRIADHLEKILPLTSAIDNLGNFDISGLKKAQDQIDAIFNAEKKISRQKAKPRVDRSDLKYTAKSLDEIYDKFKKVGTNADFSNLGLKELESGLRKSESAAKRLNDRLEKKIATEGTEKLGKSWESLVYDIQKATNQVEIYSDAISDAKRNMPDFTITRNGQTYKPNDFNAVSGSSIQDLLEEYSDLGKDIELPDFKNKEEILSFIEKYESEMDKAWDTASRATSSVDLDNAIREFSIFSNYIEKARSAYSEFVNLPGVDSSKTEEATKRLYTYDALIKEVKSDLSDLANKGLGEGDAEYDEKVRLLKQLQIEQKRYNKEQENAAKANLGIKETDNNIKSIRKNLGKTNNVLYKFGKIASKAFGNALSQAKRLSTEILGIRKQSNKGMPFGRMLGSSVAFSFVFQGISAIQNAIKEGSDNLAQYSDTYNQSISSMVSSLMYLKNAWAAAFAPIANVVAPYISSFIDMIASALNAVGQFMAALTGKGFAVQAKKVWKDYGSGLADAGSSADGANDSMKELQKTILGFDQLNILNAPDKGSGSGSGGSSRGAGADISPSDMFETIQTTGAVADFAKQIREAFLNEDWEGLGAILASGVNKGLQKLYDVISWRNVGPKITAFANAFTTTFNSLVDNVNWNLMGNTVGAGINTIVNTANLFLEGINWKNLGSSFATGIMGIVDEVNWTNLGKLLGNKFMVAWRVLLGFVYTLDFGEIGISLANGFNGAIESIDLSVTGAGIGKALSGILELFREFAKNANWSEVGDEIANGINSFFDNFKFSKLSSALNAWVKGLRKALTKAISKIKWGDAFEEITDFAGNLNLDTAFLIAIPAVNKLQNALKKLDIAKIQQNFEKFKNLFNGNFFGNLQTQIQNVIGQMSGLQKGVIGTVAVFGEFSLLKNAFYDIASGSDNLVSSLGKIAAGAGAAVAALKLIGLSNPFTAVITGATALISAIVGINTAMKGVAENTMFETLRTTGTVTLQELGNVATDAFGKITSGVDTSIEKLNQIQTTKESIDNTVVSIDSIRSAINNGAYSVSEKVPEIISQFQSLLDNTKQIFDEEYNVIVGNVVGAWADILEAQGQSVPEVVSQLASLRDEGTTAYSELETSIEDLIEQYQNGTISADDFYKKSQPLFDELKTLNSDGEIDETTTAIKNLGGALDLSQYVDGDSFDTSGFQTYMDEVIETATTGKDNLKTLGEENADTITAFKDQLDQLGADTSKIDWASLYGASDKQVSQGISDIDSAYQDYADQIQYNLLNQLPSVVEDATKDYDKLNPIQKIFTSEEKYVQNAIDSWKENVLSPISDSLEDGFEQLGIDGEVWAGDASEKLVSSIFDSITTYTSNSMPITTETLKENWKTILNDSLQGAADAVDAESYGKDTVDGYNNGINYNSDSTKTAIQNWMNTIPDSIHDSSMKFGSPSKTAEQYGKWTIEGYNNGVIDSMPSTKKAIESYMKTVRSSIAKQAKDVSDSLVVEMKNAWASIKNAYSDVNSFFKNTFSNAYRSTTTTWNPINSWFSSKWNSIKNVFSPSVANSFKNWFQTAYKSVQSAWEPANTWFLQKWTSIKNVFKDVNSYFKSGFQTAYNSVKNIWDGLGDFFRKVAQNAFNPIKKLVNGIISGVNWVLKEVDSRTRVSSWGGVAFAKGSDGIPQDTFGMVNDQKGATYKELIVPPNGKAFIPNGRNVMLPLQKGTKIMPARQTKELMKSMKISKFAKGKGFTGDVMDYLQDPEGITQIAFDKYADTSRLSGVWKNIASGILNTVFGSVSDFIGNEFEKVIPKVDYNPSAGVEQWRQLAAYALRLTGQYNEANLNRLLMQMQTESGGNPNAINNWDINAKNGTPSKGLMQVIDPTFQAYKMPGYNNIWDPLSNMLASIRYTVSRYGSLARGWQGHGYAEGIGTFSASDFKRSISCFKNGGFPNKGELFIANERRPEFVGRMGTKTTVASNVQITEGIKQAVIEGFMEVLMSTGALERNEKTQTFYIEVKTENDEVLARAVKRGNEKLDYRFNPSPAY